MGPFVKLRTPSPSANRLTILMGHIFTSCEVRSRPQDWFRVSMQVAADKCRETGNTVLQPGEALRLQGLRPIGTTGNRRVATARCSLPQLFWDLQPVHSPAHPSLRHLRACLLIFHHLEAADLAYRSFILVQVSAHKVFAEPFCNTRPDRAPRSACRPITIMIRKANSFHFSC